MNTLRGARPRGILRALVAVLLSVVLYLLAQQYMRFTVVHGNSMYPTYKSGDLLYIRPAASYGVGDVVAYHPKDLPCDLCNVVHRVVSGDAERGWITQGDNNPVVDGWQVKPDEVNGKVLLHISVPPWAQVIYKQQFWLCLIGICLGLFFLMWLIDSKQEETVAKTSPSVMQAK